VKIGEFELQQSIEFPISSKDTVTLNSKLNASNSFGTGLAELGIRRVLSSDSYIDVNS
jgi:hypothetical protein